MLDRLMSLLGLFVLVALAWLFSTNRRRINWHTVAFGMGLQLVLGIILLTIPQTERIFHWLTDKVAQFLSMSEVGARFVFGPFADKQQFGFVLVVHVVPTIIFFSAFIAILYYLGIVQRVVVSVAWVMRRTMRTSGAETLSTSANIFVGMTEAPLLIRPYIDQMTLSELHAVMVGGFATIAGGVLAAYIGFGIPANHLIIASVMSAPAALVVAKLLVPETEHSATAGDVALPRLDVGCNVLDAAARGTTDGARLALNVAVMLIAFLSLLAVVDWILGGLDAVIDGSLLGGVAYLDQGRPVAYAGWFPASLRTILGYLFAPLAFVLGVPWREAGAVGHLLGLKICANEFIAYAGLAEMMKAGTLSERSIVIATYALCGFANFGSIGIQIGGIGALAPGRRSDLARLGLRAMCGGALASWMTAAIAGMLI